MNRHLHIVCPYMPWPADHGKSIDILYRIMALHAQGIKIQLHYFILDHEKKPNELNRFCESIHIYQKPEINNASFMSGLQPDVFSEEEIIDNLSKDNYPIIVEGASVAVLILSLLNNKRRIAVRIYTDEVSYARQLAKSEKNIFKKLHYWKLKRKWEKIYNKLPPDFIYACRSANDQKIIERKYGLPNVKLLPSFIAWPSITCKEGVGHFCLYHGDLSSPENEKAATWLLTNVFNDLKIPLVIAGRNPGPRIKSLTSFMNNTCLIADPSDAELEDLISKAQIHTLPFFIQQQPGPKLVHALKSGRHCIVTDHVLNGSGYEASCHVATNAAAFKSIIHQLYRKPFEEEEILLRNRILKEPDNNTQSAILIQWLFD